MANLRRIWFRAYPTVVTIWLCLVNRALALDVSTAFLATPSSAQTEDVKAQPRAGGRGDDKRLQGLHLSQAARPSRRPILTVDAPAETREVTAYFPFGPIRPLTFDATRKHWVVRFLVPRDVVDGHYTLTVRIVDSAGHASWKNIDYALDSAAPELDVRLDPLAWAGELLHVTVDPLEPVKDVYATLPGVSKRRVHLKLNVDSGLYEGDIPVPLELSHEDITVRLVAHGLTRNQVQTDIVVPVSLDGC